MQYLCEIYNSVICGKTPAAPSGRFEKLRVFRREITAGGAHAVRPGME